MLKTLRIIPGVTATTATSKMRFLEFGSEIVIYPAMGDMDEDEVIETLLQIANTKSGNGHTRYTMTGGSPPQAEGCAAHINTALSNAYSRGWIQKYADFSKVEIGITVTHCGLVIERSHKTHGDVIDDWRKQNGLPRIS